MVEPSRCVSEGKRQIPEPIRRTGTAITVVTQASLSKNRKFYQNWTNAKVNACLCSRNFIFTIYKAQPSQVLFRQGSTISIVGVKPQIQIVRP